MICPFCNADNDRVIDSRAAENGAAVRRRRGCIACGRRFTTYERVEKTARLMVVKKDGSRVPFEPQNVLRGIQAACGKRPIPEEAKTRLVQEIEDTLYRDYDREVPSEEIGKLVATRLRDLDQIAYIRFASEHYSYRSLDDMAEELQELRRRPRDLPNQADLFAGEPQPGAPRPRTPHGS